MKNGESKKHKIVKIKRKTLRYPAGCFNYRSVSLKHDGTDGTIF